MGNMQTVYPFPLDQRIAENKTIKEITESTSLAVYEEVVFVTVPATGTLTITLPGVTEARGKRYLIVAVGQAANYSDGDVNIASRQDEYIKFGAYSTSNVVGDNLTAAKDYAIIENIAGLGWRVVAEVTT